MGSRWGPPWPTTTIDKIEQLGDVKLNFENLSKKYGTFRSCSNGTDRLGRKKYRSRIGAQTDYGDIEITLWCTLVRKLIDEHNEQKLFNHMKAWVIRSCQGFEHKPDLEIEALELYCCRIFDDPLWAGFVPFNEKYRPEVLENIELVWVVNQVETTPQRITRIKMEDDNERSFIHRSCGAWVEVDNPNGG